MRRICLNWASFLIREAGGVTEILLVSRKKVSSKRRETFWEADFCEFFVWFEGLKNHEVLEDHFKKNNRVKEYAGHSSKVHSVDWNCTGSRLASGSCDRTVCIFDLDDSNKLVRQGVRRSGRIEK